MDERSEAELRATLSAMGDAGEPAEGNWSAVQARAHAVVRRRHRQQGALAFAALVVVAAIGLGVRAQGRDQTVRIVPEDGTSTSSSSSAPTSTSTSTPSPATVPGTATTVPSGSTKALGSLNAVQMLSTKVGFAVGDNGTIVRTDDGGQTWRSLAVCGNAAFCGTADLTYLDMVSDKVGFAGGRAVALRTTDGQHWFEYTNKPLLNVHFINASEGWGVPATANAPNVSGVAVHTTDGGNNWTEIPTGATAQTVCFSARSDGWYTTADTVFHSTDGGASWTESFRLPSEAGASGGADVQLQCASGGAAWVQFAPDNGAAGHQPYLLYSTQNGGTDWHLVFDNQFLYQSTVPAPDGPGASPGPFSIIDGATAFATGNSSAANNVSGVLITNGSSLGPLHTISNSGFDAKGASFTDTQHGWVVGSESGKGAIYTTSDGGATWSRQS